MAGTLSSIITKNKNIDVIYYKVVTSDTEYSKDDIIKKINYINDITLLSNGIIRWKNVSTDSLLTSEPNLSHLDRIVSDKIKIGSETLNIDDTVKVLTSKPVNANYAEIHVWYNDIVFTTDGVTTPSVNSGYRQAVNQFFILDTKDELNNFQVTRLNDNNATLYIEYTVKINDMTLG